MKILMIILRNNKDMFVYDKNDCESRYNPIVQLGMPYIAAYLKRDNYIVEGMNLNDENGRIRDIMKSHLEKSNYDVIFTGGTSLYYPNCKDLIQFIREFSDAKIVVGGGLISSDPTLMMDMLKPDFGIIFEGEETALELTRFIEDPDLVPGGLPSIRGIAYHDGEKVIVNPPRPPIKDLDSLPYPDFDVFGFKKQIETFRPHYIAYDHTEEPRPYSIIASRGCPFSCTFCFHTIGKGYRERSVDSIMGEIQYAIDKYRANVIFFNDELFSYDKPRTLEICRRIKEIRKGTPWEITVMANNRVDKIDDEILDAICSDMNCNVVGFGLESFSNTVLRSMRKHITSEQIRKSIQGVSDRNCVVQGSFIFGDTAETLETAQETLDFYLNNQDIIKNAAQLTFIMAFPGTPIYKSAVARGIIQDERDYIENTIPKVCNTVTPMNLTMMSDEDFEILKNRVWTAEYISHRSAFPISINGGIITAVCPYCHTKQDFRNAVYPSFVGCRHCSGRFRLAEWWYKLTQAIVKIFGFNFCYNLRSKVIRK